MSETLPSPSGHSHSHVHDTPVSEETVASVRSHLLPEFRTTCDDDTIRRFVRATGGNLALSAKRLNNTCHWRRDTKPESIVCQACAANPRSHYMHVIGYDNLNRPIIYSCLALATNRDYEDNRAHMIQTFETAIKCMPTGVSQWVWVCDFHGFGMQDINPKLAKSFLDISAEHYPERLGLFVVLDAPSLFNVLWKAISAFVDPKTYQKIKFLPYDCGKKAKSSGSSKLMSELSKHLDETTLGWLGQEMAENREKALAQSKVYCMSQIHKSASEGALVLSMEGARHRHDSGCADAAAIAAMSTLSTSDPDASTTSAGSSAKAPGEGKACAAAAAADPSRPHDNRGTPALLVRYATMPGLLEPQAVTKA